jgi:hypothetical protein
VPGYADDESKENHGIGRVRPALGWNYCVGMVDRGRARACATDERERPCFCASANPWKSGRVAGATQIPRRHTRTQREITFTPPRNIFAPPRTVASGAVSVNRPEVDADSEQARRRQAALAGLALFHYLGFVRVEEVLPKKGEMAVLTKKDDLHVVRTGETVEDHVVVKAITQESVTLLDRRSRVEHIVLLSKDAPLEDALLQPE